MKKLTRKQKEMVEKWLKLTEFEEKDTCPFKDGPAFPSNSDLVCIDICFQRFPKCRPKPSLTIGKHPCQVYSHKTVIRRAKEMVR